MGLWNINPFKKSETPLQLMQFYEYLSLLDRGIHQVEIGDVEQKALGTAKAIWEKTGLDPWNRHNRYVQWSYETNDGKVRLVHVTADHENSFVIVIVDNTTAKPTYYLVFDIGSQYTEPIFVCPPANHNGPVTEELIERCLPLLINHADPFAVIDVGPGTYMQVLQISDNEYLLEHQLVTTANHFQVSSPVSLATAIDAMKSYAFGKYEWAKSFEWKKIDI